VEGTAGETSATGSSRGAARAENSEIPDGRVCVQWPAAGRSMMKEDEREPQSPGSESGRI